MKSLKKSGVRVWGRDSRGRGVESRDGSTRMEELDLASGIKPLKAPACAKCVSWQHVPRKAGVGFCGKTRRAEPLWQLWLQAVHQNTEVRAPKSRNIKSLSLINWCFWDFQISSSLLLPKMTVLFQALDHFSFLLKSNPVLDSSNLSWQSCLYM